MPRRLAVTLWCVCLAAGAAAADVVERRGAEPALEGEIVTVDDAGVTVRSGLGASHFVAWDRVRRLRTSRDDPTLGSRLAVAADLWRARSRVERGDTELAEPLLERLFERYRGSTHETALVAAEGLLRCRIARADHVLALVPALEVARLRRAGVTTESYATLPPVYDPAYALCTTLAPVWLPSPLLESAAHDLSTYDAGGDEVTLALARLYRQMIARALGEPERIDDDTLPDHPGVELLRRLRDCGSGDPDRQTAARNQLVRAVASLPPWAEAWSRYAIGVSLVAEDRLERIQEGALSLIHVPARFGRTQPYLAGLALARAAEALSRLADADGAATLRHELRTSYPHHPVHLIDSPDRAAALRDEDA